MRSVCSRLTVLFYQFLLNLMWHFRVMAEVHRETALAAGQGFQA
jgi:hypothetical protein